MCVCVCVCVCVCRTFCFLLTSSYKTHESCGRAQVFFRNYSQRWKSDDTEMHTHGRPEVTATRKNVVTAPYAHNV